jgi:hypothetical protein
VRRRVVATLTLSAILAVATVVAAKPPVRVPEDYQGEVVRITVRTAGKERGEVYWGKTLLGETPLVIERPRDSGPMDLVIRARGFLTLRTRAYTFSDDRLAVHLTPVAKKATLFGYREPVPDAGVPDGGATPP